MSLGFPTIRPRRLRRTPWLRRLVRAHRLAVEDLIWPLFLCEGEDRIEPIDLLPGVSRHSIDRAVAAVREAAVLGIPAVALFPNTPTGLRSPDGAEALNPDNLVCRAIRAVKQAVPEIGVICDVALDPYTDHGHDGLLAADGSVDNDATLPLLARQAVLQAEAGCDILAPSDMMDGRVAAIRAVLDASGFPNAAILSYAVKYASAFYGPFKAAVGADAMPYQDKRGYQMDPGNAREARREAALDVAEGADMLMVKPGLPYLDVLARLRGETDLPLFAYQVSGEFAMLRHAAAAGAFEYDRALLESLLSCKRAGADAILTYGALDAARLLAAGADGAVPG